MSERDDIKRRKNGKRRSRRRKGKGGFSGSGLGMMAVLGIAMLVLLVFGIRKVQSSLSPRETVAVLESGPSAEETSFSEEKESRVETESTENASGNHESETSAESSAEPSEPVEAEKTWALPKTPVAAYFATDTMSIYKANNDLYKEREIIFSDTTRDVLDIVYYSFATIGEDGSCKLNDTKYLYIIPSLHKDKIRVLLTVDGISKQTSSAFAKVAASDELSAKFAKSVVDLCHMHGFDGVDLDWEYINSNAHPTADGMNRISRAIKREMNAQGADREVPYMLTCAIPASSWALSDDRYDFPELAKYIDYINLMSYDMNHEAYASHLSPMYSSSYDNSGSFGVAYGVNRIGEKGYPISHILVGCAGYGKGYKLKNPDSIGDGQYPGLGMKGSYAQIPGVSGSYKSGTVLGQGLKSLFSDENFHQYTEYNSKGNYVGTYLLNRKDGYFVTFEGKKSFQEKYKYANTVDGLGVMLWSFTEDVDNRYVNALAEVME